MILQELYILAEREGLMEDPDYEWRPVTWLVRISRDGRIITPLEDTRSIPEIASHAGKISRPPKPVAKNFRLPREKSRQSGDRAFFLYDKAEYVFGVDPEGTRETEKLESRFNLFRERVEECLKIIEDEGVAKLLMALDAYSADRSSVALPDKIAPNDLFAFIYDPDIDSLLTDRPAVRSYWASLRQVAGEVGEQQVCLVSGDPFSGKVDNFPGVKRVPGGTTSGVALVSYNKSAFESYGWKGNENASISRQSSEMAAEALRRLLDPAYPDPAQPGQSLSKRNIHLSADTAVCYWPAAPSGDGFCNAFSGILDANPEEVGELYRSVWRGVPPPILSDSAFYALVISGAQGRAIVRDWIESTVSKASSNLAKHFRDLSVVRNTPPPKEKGHSPQFGLRLLLESLSPEGDREKIPPPLVGQMAMAAINGTLYPTSMLQKALERERAEVGKHDWKDENRRDARAAVIKAVLNRKQRYFQETTKYQEVKESMDPGNQNQGYLLGQMMAVLERLQQTAQGDVGATVVDRYFSSASASPRAVFPRLLKNARHHVSKAKDGASAGMAFRLDRLLDDLSSKAGVTKTMGYNLVENAQSFPAYLPLEDQGLFVLGYHHMRKWLWLSKEERSAWHQENQDIPAAYIWS
ncbi:type I-C CRISPR-associated protein Cas8c/Csd1 [Dehalogenimonas sp. THU2]|uniref:type I-C CRISPR-associated protein Cas8c/Csd1 n=1 Tax=Dehalogenimonas sp. THU2 TaxID=3151121 RepID=UPI003218B601